jgi:hypothetical protein
MPDLDDLAGELEESIAELLEAAGGRPGIFRRFVPRAEVEAAEKNGHGKREESTTG